MFRSHWGIPILRIIDETGKVIKINSLEPIEIENKYFKGVILPMIKCDGEYEQFNTYRNYFSKSNRKFEIQFQVIIKLYCLFYSLLYLLISTFPYHYLFTSTYPYLSTNQCIYIYI